MGVIHITEIIKTFLIGIFFGTFGTTIGGLIGVNLKAIQINFWIYIVFCIRLNDGDYMF